MQSSREVRVHVSSLPSAQQSTVVQALEQLKAGIRAMRQFSAQNHDYSVATLSECQLNNANNTLLVPIHDVDCVDVNSTALELSTHLGRTVEMSVDAGHRECTICWQLAPPSRRSALWWHFFLTVFWALVLVLSAFLYKHFFMRH
jgi:hypothetical protein